MLTLRQLTTTAPEFSQQLRQLLEFTADDAAAISATVSQIVTAVRERGDAALVEYTNRFDQRAVQAAGELEIKNCADFVAQIPTAMREALQAAAIRIQRFHQHQRQASWHYHDEDGTLLGQQITALERVGVYVPGGKAAYPSSVLMNVIPAVVAGVDEIIMVVPAPRGALNWTRM